MKFETYIENERFVHVCLLLILLTFKIQCVDVFEGFVLSLYFSSTFKKKFGVTDSLQSKHLS